MSDLGAIVKAYDVRGTVPDQLNEDVARALGAAFVQMLRGWRRGRRHRSSSRTTCATPRPAWPPRSPRARAARAPTSSRPGLGSTDLLYFASGQLDLPGAMFTASHNPAQYNGIKMCRARGQADRPGHRAGRDPGPGAGASWTAPSSSVRRRAPSRDTVTCSPSTPSYLRSLVDLSDDPAADGRGRRRQRHGRVHRAGRARATPCCATLPLTIMPLYFELDGTFPNHEANPLEPKNIVDLQARGARARRRPRARLRRRRRPLLRRRRARRAGLAERGHRAGGHPRTGQAPGRHDHPQPDHVPGRAGDRHRARRHPGAQPGSGTRSSRPRWPVRARSSAGSTRPTTTSGTSGAPTPACWPRCTCWPRWAGRSGRCPSWPRRSSGTSPRARSTRRSPTRPAKIAEVEAAFPDAGRRTSWTA